MQHITLSCACVEGRATRESDLSADTGGYTAGQGLRTLPFFVPARLVAHKAINSSGRSYTAPVLAIPLCLSANARIPERKSCSVSTCT